MRIRANYLLVPLALILCCTASSCQRGPAPVTAVSGRVTYLGSPLPTGTIVFAPDTTRGENGAVAVGAILGDGSYTLKTGESLGAAAGWYRVTVTSLASSTSFPGQSFLVPQSIIPEKYRDPNLSELVCEIKPHQPNTIDFQLK